MSTSIAKIEEGTITPGDIVSSNMHMHMPTGGVCDGWSLFDSFEITKLMFDTMVSEARLKMGDCADTRPVPGKAAVAINYAVDIDGYISSVLVVYRYDFEYRCAMLYDPGWFPRKS